MMMDEAGEDLKALAEKHARTISEQVDASREGQLETVDEGATPEVVAKKRAALDGACGGEGDAGEGRGLLGFWRVPGKPGKRRPWPATCRSGRGPRGQRGGGGPDTR